MKFGLEDQASGFLLSSLFYFFIFFLIFSFKFVADETLRILHVAQVIGIEKLASVASLYMRHHPKFPQVVLIEVDKQTSPVYAHAIQQCAQAFVFDKNDFRLLCFGPSMFFDHNDEDNRQEIDWKTARVQEYVGEC
jgi:hypothetical protein